MIAEASLSGLFRIILWILIFSVVVRLVVRIAVPMVVKRATDPQFKRSQKPTRPEGEVTVERTAPSSGKSSDGDYVDFVEIKD